MDRPAAHGQGRWQPADTAASAMAGTSWGEGGADVLGVAALADDPELKGFGVEGRNDPTGGHQHPEGRIEQQCPSQKDNSLDGALPGDPRWPGDVVDPGLAGLGVGEPDDQPSGDDLHAVLVGLAVLLDGQGLAEDREGADAGDDVVGWRGDRYAARVRVRVGAGAGGQQGDRQDGQSEDTKSTRCAHDKHHLTVVGSFAKGSQRQCSSETSLSDLPLWPGR